MTGLPVFERPDLWTTCAFTAIVLGLIALLVWGTHVAAPPDEPPERTRQWVRGVAGGALLWLGLTAIAPATGLMAAGAPASLMVFVLCSNLVAIGVAVSPLGTRLLRLPVAALLGVQAFRLPLEIILHSWYAQGSLPIQMTWESHNQDVISGVVSLFFGLYALRWKPPLGLVWVVNLLGLGLLLNVMRVAVTSSPIPLRTFLNDPPVLLGFHLPYAWIVPFCVSGALMGHLVVLRWCLRAQRRSARTNP